MKKLEVEKISELDKLINTALLKIKESKPSLDTLIESCPFDPQKNLNKKLIPELFFHEEIGMYFENSSIKKLRFKISNDYFSGKWNKRLLFLYGYSGIGKSTFVRNFFYTTTEKIKTTIIDFQEIVTYIQTEAEKNDESIEKNVNSTNNHSDVNPINLGIQQFIFKKDSNLQQEFITFLRRNKKSLRIYFSNFYARFDKIIEESKEEKGKVINEIEISTWHDILLKSNFNDSLILFFTFLMNQKDGRIKNIIVFDNLDCIELDYFSDEFVTLFPNILDKISLISQDENVFSEPIDVVSKYKFIFCLREANNAQINSNNSDKIWYNKIEEKVTFNHEVYQGAFLKRLDFISLIYSSEELNNLLGLSIESIKQIAQKYFNDFTFSNVFLPLFNFDFRKLTTTLFTILSEMGENALNLLSPNPEIYFRYNSIVYFGLIKSLSKNNYIEAFYNQRVNWEDPVGFCHPARVILTHIINYCNTRINGPERQSLVKTEISLFDLVSSFDKKYDVKTITNTLLSLFQHHVDGWIHPITIRHKEIQSNKSFDTEIDKIERLEKLNEIENKGKLLSDKQYLDFKKIKSELYKIKIRPNPASYSFLRFIIPNYDYYLVITKATKSIFKFESSQISNPESEQRLAIEKVLLTATNHINVMRKFTQNKYLSDGFSINDLRLSSHTWKFTGKDKNPSELGFLHSERIINAHIGHLEKYRQYIIEKVSNFNTKMSVNKYLTDLINRYNDLYKGTLDLDNLDKFHFKFKEKIDKIKGSGYTDFNTKIEL